MNPAHIHLLLNHLPIVATIIGTLVLIFGFILKNNSIVKQTALGILIFSSLTAIPAYISGEGAEEIVENIPGISEQFIETHEDLGKLFLIANIIMGIVASITWALSIKKRSVSNLMYYAVLIIAILNCIAAAKTGTSGGEIRHTEIRSNYQVGTDKNAIDTHTKPEEEDED